MPLRVDNCRGTFSRPDARAARFLFFLSMPAVLAGGLLEFKETLKYLGSKDLKFSANMKLQYFSREAAKKEKGEHSGSELGEGKLSLKYEKGNSHPSNLTFHIWSEATSRCCLRNFDGFNLPPLLRILA